MNADMLRNFEEAFQLPIGSSQRACHCGRVFYNPQGGWDWEEGELEELKNNHKSQAVEWSVGVLMFEGKEYALDCDCWHRRAEQIVAFIDGHARQIADFLTAEKSRKQKLADESPVVNP